VQGCAQTQSDAGNWINPAPLPAKAENTFAAKDTMNNSSWLAKDNDVLQLARNY
jgi:hypothetical protein